MRSLSRRLGECTLAESQGAEEEGEEGPTADGSERGGGGAGAGRRRGSDRGHGPLAAAQRGNTRAGGGEPRRGCASKGPCASQSFCRLQCPHRHCLELGARNFRGPETDRGVKRHRERRGLWDTVGTALGSRGVDWPSPVFLTRPSPRRGPGKEASRNAHWPVGDSLPLRLTWVADHPL